MSSFTDERVAKLIGNMHFPEGTSLASLKRSLEAMTLGVHPLKVKREAIINALQPTPGQILDPMKTLTEPFAVQNRLSWIVDALGPDGVNVLTQRGIDMIESGIRDLLELESMDPSSPAAKEKLEAYNGPTRARLAGQYTLTFTSDEGVPEASLPAPEFHMGGFFAFERIVDLVKERYKEGLDGMILLFDTELPPKPVEGSVDYKDEMAKYWEAETDIQTAAIFRRRIEDWVASGLGGPRLLQMSVNEQLMAVSHFPEAMQRAYELSHPEVDHAAIKAERESLAVDKEYVEPATPGDFTISGYFPRLGLFKDQVVDADALASMARSEFKPEAPNTMDILMQERGL